MSDDRLEVDIEYISDGDDETPCIVVKTFPKVGNFIRTSKREYKVEKIVFNDDIPMSMKTARFVAVVSPA